MKVSIKDMNVTCEGKRCGKKIKFKSSEASLLHSPRKPNKGSRENTKGFEYLALKVQYLRA